MITLIRGGWVMAYDGRHHHVIPNGETPGMLVSPGFINTHGHIGVELMAAFVDTPVVGDRPARYSLSEARAARSDLPQSLTVENSNCPQMLGLDFMPPLLAPGDS